MPGRPSPAVLLRLTTGTSSLDRYVMPPMLVAIAADLGVSLADVVAAAGAYFLVYGLTQPLWGFASDRFGRVRTMRVTLALAGVCSLLSALSPTVAALAVARALAGGFFGAAYPSTLVYVGDTVPPERRQRQITGLMVGVALGTALASVGGGLLADVATWRAAFVVTGTASVVLAVLLGALPEPASDQPRPRPMAAIRAIRRTPVALVVLCFALVEGAVLLGALTLLPAAVESGGASATVAGAVAAVYGAAVLVGSQVVGRLSATWPPARLIAIGGSFAVVGSLLVVVARSPWSAVLAATCIGLAWTSMHSSLQTWATQVVPGARATMVSFFASALFVGNALGAALVGGLAEAGRFWVVYAGFAALAVPLTVLATWRRARWSDPDAA
ncbi:MFS transporter [Nocardioides zeae]|uniref:MFS transporter n=1 Tax=Nocardioides imazamoxiresistens TaxID=3231893 RepID=A0ABU3PSF0_9ACTN|nr:MFS transporter [Nocardioides zeae]MDT9592109.1 MFS transporter [Nocardioides zeae]